ncbi:hypothetical protein QAD02_014794 [Eretmocerus hayati]|uniref:Uncharacterized protein n=1 Tax=Eretmocerus hayati TaxID=131215 RepID=A0ACC2P6G7_9HYME|nr:hypothetical protein QAD02_014794 [Eretmocerus hayati]
MGDILKPVRIFSLLFHDVQDSPFIKVQEGLTGFFAKILSELELKLNFTKRVMNEYDPYGCYDSDSGEWTGAIGRLTRGEADLGMADFTMTKERLDAIDFTHPVLLSRNYLYMRQPEGSALQWFSYFRVFNADVWIAIKLLYTFSFLIISLMRTIVKERPTLPHYNSDTYLGVWGILWQQALPRFPSSSPLRMAYFSLFVSAVILLATYSGCLTSYVAVTIPTLPFSDFAGFAEDGSYRLAVIQQSNDPDIFINSTDMILRKMQRLMVDPPDQPRTLMDGFNKACHQNLAFYSTEAIKSQINALIPCDLVYVKSGTMDSLGITLTKNSQYRRIFNYHLVKLRDVGIMGRLRAASYARVNPPENKFQPVDIGAVFSILLILGMGMMLSVLILILEKIAHCVRVSRQKQTFVEKRVAVLMKISELYGDKLANLNIRR